MTLTVGLIVIAAVLSLTFFVAFRLVAHWGPAAASKEAAPEAFSAVDLITILLACVTVILTALAIVLALAGAVGYVTLREALTNAAVKEAGTVSRETAADAATQTVREMVPRLVEEALQLELGRSSTFGEDFAASEGRSDVNDHSAG